MIAPRPRYEFLMNVMFKDNGKVAFKNIEPTEMELAKLEIPQKDITEDERSVDSDDDFQDSPPKKIKERSNKKQKVDSSTLVAKKPSGKKQVNIVDVHTQTMTPPHRASKADVMKTPVFKPIPTRQASSSKMIEGKQTTRVIFPVQSKADSHVEEVAMSKRESHVEKEIFISKKVFDAFREEQQREDIEVEAQQMDYAGVETSPQQFSPTVDQNLDENQDGTKGCIDLHPDKTNIEIDSQHLIPNELLQSINLDYNLSEKIVHHDDQITDEKLDDTNLSDSQFTIPDELLPSLNASRRESITRHSLANSEEEQIDKYFNDKKKNKENVGSCSKADMHREVDLGTDEQIMRTPKIQELTTDEQRDETVFPDSQDTIPDDLLPSLNVYSSKSIIVHPSANCELQTPIPKLRIRPPSPYTMKFGSATDHYKRGKSTIPMMHFRIETIEDKNWFYIMGFPDQSWTDSHIVVCFYYLRKKSKYDPNRSYKFSTVNYNFMNIIRSVHDVYSADAENLTVGGHAAHLIEYINGFRMHAAVPWHTVEDIYIPVNIKEKHHWVLAILSFSERCIFLYDSYESSSHYSAVLDVIEKLVAIIPLWLEHCDFYVKKEIHVEHHPRYKGKDSSDMFDVLFQESLPQQPSGSLDCGVYIVTYAECLSYGHKILANEFDPNAVRTRYVALLWDYETRKQDVNAHSDVEAPLRPPRQSRITSVTEVFDV
ncbi:hypothetical protein CQW23_25878 [Capsicum baccatum]|uniref:Ubiquitin-like protease family profile domain-containing protein n=1 Tax=Capsicum baccatum TaxID=33114 RepID=A0A2G2VM80_CAPBA|nr:hypothetical protein CQW23_25878 [Capsicum baccatum]